MKRLAVLAIALLATVPAGAGAQSGPEPAPGARAPSATERLQEGAAAIVDGLRLLMDQLQSYQPPEVMPNGDIIIRRRPPAGAEPPPDGEAPGDTAPGDGGDRPLKL